MSYSEKNLAAVVKGDKSIDLRPWSVPDIGENEVLLSISAVGICGSDLKYWAYGKCGRFSLEGNPMVIGHEASGVVEKIGRDVKQLEPGDRVAIEPGVSCKKCDFCKSGRYNLCKKMRFCATPPVHGNLCRYYVHDADFCFKIPATMTAEEGAMLEPLSVAIHTCKRAGVQEGHHVVIFGAGPIGLLCGLVAKNYGAKQILTVDIDENRLKIAREFKATDLTYRVTANDKDPKELAEKLHQVARDDGCHAALECSGADSSLKAAMHVSRPGGSVMLVGRGSLDVKLPMVMAGTFEIDIKGIFRYANTYPEAIRLVSSGAIDVTKLITHRFELETADDAFRTASDPKSEAIKIMIKCGV
ncbi:sorbitol dehydrogenase-like [Clavelina lepadiformis]|uniref:sorbitol dehydrogenase-like n=1 Tax=Clavelina lepadiformis TaxID=159417 RepID=UPI004041413E